MNEQIRKFERESHIDVYALGRDRAKWETAMTRFAELIVRECALIAGLMEHEGRKKIGAQILDSFGVE